jgi:hypothetical protein
MLMAKHARLSLNSVHNGIVTECAKLKDFGERVFFTVEVRRKKILSRIKVRAESTYQVVSVVDGVLSMRCRAVFSLKDGKVNQDGGISLLY